MILVIGKSLTTFAFVNMILLSSKVSKVIYLDGDNGLTTIKERKVHLVKENHGDKLIYLQGLKASEYVRGYDVDEEVSLYATSLGKNGVPATFKDLLKDMNEAKRMWTQLAKNLKKLK